MSDSPHRGPQSDHLPEWMTRAQVATYAQVSERTVDRAIRAGRLSATKIDSAVRVHRDAAMAWLADGEDA